MNHFFGPKTYGPRMIAWIEKFTLTRGRLCSWWRLKLRWIIPNPRWSIKNAGFLWFFWWHFLRRYSFRALPVINQKCFVFLKNQTPRIPKMHSFFFVKTTLSRHPSAISQTHDTRLLQNACSFNQCRENRIVMGLGASRHDYLLFKAKGEVGQKIRSRSCVKFSSYSSPVWPFNSKYLLITVIDCYEWICFWRRGNECQTSL